ncbi:MAG: ornithine cyclodeaminase family protein [Chloroflexaceae bacterium]|nr:ornithine cyclodeaminase family protein [Chloroflexaceae bacterium]
MRILSGEDVRQAISMKEAIAVTANAFVQLTAREAALPLRARIELPHHEAVSLFMPAYLAQSQALGTKIVSVFPHNPTRFNAPSIYALIALFDAETGRPVAVMDGTYLTALRTGAVSGVATQYMARADTHVLALFGAGVQARTQVQAVCAVRPIREIRIVNRTPARADDLIELLKTDGIDAAIERVDNAAAALRGADVVCCATGATVPLFDAADIQPGTHINAIGSHDPRMAEVPAATVARARVVVDEHAAARAEAGDILQAEAAGLIDAGHVLGELARLSLAALPPAPSRRCDLF